MGYRELGLQYSGPDLEEPVDKEARLGTARMYVYWDGCRLESDVWHEVRQSRVTKEKASFFGGAGWLNLKLISFDQLRFYANFQPEYCV